MAPKRLHALLALAALVSVPALGAPLVLAQSAASPPEAAEPEPQPVPAAVPAPAPKPEPVIRPQATAPPEPAVVRPSGRAADLPARQQPRVPPAPLPGTQTLRPPAAGIARQSPARFDQSLDSLVRDQVIKPSERVRVRGNLVLPQAGAAREEACRNGALSQQECRSGVVFLGRGRRDGRGSSPDVQASPDGSLSPSADTIAGLGGGLHGRGSVDAAPLPPISVPVSALLSGAGGNFRLSDVFRVTPRPGPISGNGNARLLFPLIGSAVPSSPFGWRLHPILGNWLMHAGRDFAAPEGTPVVASLSGRVVSSGVAGGYGLAVEIEHDRPRRRTLYGHLSELYVKAGDKVRQGEVIGRVGSTGLSTGPHLHFELRVPQDGGWVAVDPGDMDEGDTMIAARSGLPGGSATTSPDAVALLMAQLIQTLERPRSPLAGPGTAAPALPAPAPGATPTTTPSPRG